jgi:hypothetical protein
MLSDQKGMARATLKNLDTGDEVEFMFRPKEYSFSKTNGWQPGKAVGLNLSPPQFTGGQPMTMSLELFFDTYEEKGSRDVRTRTAPLWAMMGIPAGQRHPNTNKGHPSYVQFTWGSLGSFTAVITQMSQKFTLFLENGTPVRSTVTIALQQAKDDDKLPLQNPTSGGPGELLVHTVTQGETIDWIAYQEYGDANAWRHLAAANDLEDPSRLVPGQRLLIAPLL